MPLWNLIQALLVFVPIGGLFLAGLVIVLRSGEASLGTSQGVQVALGNLSSLLLRVAGYLAGLLAVQYLVGFPIGW